MSLLVFEPSRPLYVLSLDAPSRESSAMISRQRRPGETPGNAKEVMLKVACDRLLLTPPFLAFTLFALRVLQGFGAARSAKEAAAIFRGALLTNWKVRTGEGHTGESNVLRVFVEECEIVDRGTGQRRRFCRSDGTPPLWRCLPHVRAFPIVVRRIV